MKHQSDPRVLNRRTLDRDHKRMAAHVRPGMSVLDVGCGTGSITAGIARACAPAIAVGLDRDPGLLAQARAAFGAITNLEFVEGEIQTWDSGRRFDAVTAARVLQWIAGPQAALQKMCDSVKPGGLAVVLDYVHEAHVWDPAPPAAFRIFYEAFLAWRAANGWSNRIGDELPDMFRAAGLLDVQSYVEDESDFARGSLLWTQVIESMGPAIVADGFLSPAERLSALDAIETWRVREGRSVNWILRSVQGVKPR